MARSLVRYVFPQFAFRVSLVLLLAALAVLVNLQQARNNTIFGELDRHVRSLAAQINSERAPDVQAALSAFNEATRLDVAFFADSANPEWSSSVELTRTIAPRLGAAGLGESLRVAPSSSRGHLFAVAQRFERTGSEETVVIAVARTRRSDPTGFAAASASLVLLLPVVLLVILLVSYRVVRGINAPLLHLQTAARRFAEGDLDYRCLLPEPNEFARLAETMNSMAAQLTARIDAIRSQRSQLEAILAGMVEGVILLDEQWQIRTMNRAARTLFRVESIESREGRPRTLLEIVRNSEIYELVEATIRSGSTQENEVVLYQTPVRHMQVHSSLVELGQQRLILVVLHDITRLHELEQIRKEFVANVSHELKTPITSIKGFVETLRDGALDDHDEARRFLEIISNHTERLSLIIEDLLQLSRLEQRQESVPRETVATCELIESVVAASAERARQRNVTFVRECTAGSTVEVSRRLMEQALTNLIENAITYGRQGGTIVVAVTVKDGEQRFTVSDDGPGIAPEDLPRLFERFYRVERARSRAAGGTGLGLAIVKHIAQAHGGTVEAASKRGSGSRFTIRIMRDQPGEGQSAAHQ